MTGPNMSYAPLCEFIPIFTRNSSSPAQVTDLNPIIQKLLTSCHGSSIFGVGGHSVIRQHADGIVAKISLKINGQHLSHELVILDLFDQMPSAHIVQTFLRVSDIIFMQLLNNGTLYQRMDIVIRPRPILLWMQQLSGAVAYLESFDIAVGDINPRNTLFDSTTKIKLKLVDFDHALKFGDELDVDYAPYVRALKVGEKGGTHGIGSPATEQLALGSVFLVHDSRQGALRRT